MWDEQVPANPEGTVGVAVMDGQHNEPLDNSAVNREETERYLQQSGIRTSPMPFKAMGSAGEFVVAVTSGVVVDVLIHAGLRARKIFDDWRVRKADRELGKHRRCCHIQLGDKRADRQDAVELLLLLPGLHSHLSEIHPNRRYSFIIFSATTSVEHVQIILNGYDSLERDIRRMAQIIRKNSDKRSLTLFLEDGPFNTRRVAYIGS